MKNREPKSAEWYDDDFKRHPGWYCRGHYRRRNQIFAEMISKYVPKRVFEFAGAEGQLAQFILQRCPQIEYYLWSDFSKEALKEAYPKLKRFKNCEMQLLDMEKDLDKIPWDVFDCVISTSLEHISNDIAIMEHIKPKTLVCLALPDFDWEGHVRYFPTKESVIQRYHKYLNFIEFKIHSGVALTDYIFENFAPLTAVKHLLWRLKLLKFVQKIGIFKSKYPPLRYLIIAEKKTEVNG